MRQQTAIRFLMLVALLWVVIIALRNSQRFVIWDETNEFFPLLFAILGVLAGIGYLAGVEYGRVSARSARSFAPRSLERATNFLSIVSLLGSCYLILDFVYVRGYGWSTDVNLIRTLEVSGDAQAGGAISGIGRLMAPAVSAAWSIYLIHRKAFRRQTALLMAAALIVHLYFETKFTGGRFFLFIIILQFLLYTRYFSDRKKLSFRSLALRAAVIVAFVFFVGSVFVSRASVSGQVLTLIFEASLTGHPAQMSPYLYAVLDTNLGTVYFAVAYIWMYLTQGIGQFFVLLDAETLPAAYGFFQFPQMAQIASRLTGFDLGYDVFRNLENPGTYNTLFGAIYIDFGYGGLVLQTLLFFGMTGAAIARLTRGQIGPLSISASMLMAAAVLSPCVNVLTNVWLGIVWLFIAIPLLGRRVDAIA
jgi:hypothetical protein